ncbi:MAG: hypothetical protein ACRCX8_11245 [Sarcina sp.]
MINKDRVLELLEDFRKWENDFKECILQIEKCENEKMGKILYHGGKAYFWDFHILCEDYISINLKELKKFRIDISAIGGMELIKDCGIVDEETLDFYDKSRRLRNRLAHRYKVPEDEVLVKNLEDNMECVEKIQKNLKQMLK